MLGLIGAPTLRAMRSSVNFENLNFGLAIDESYKIVNLLSGGDYVALTFKLKFFRRPVQKNCQNYFTIDGVSAAQKT